MEMEQAQRELVKEQEWAKAAEVRVVEGWGETAPVPDRPATASAQTAGRRSPTALELPAIR
ncbi:hypothetical protein KAX17_07265 [Candidatus Bipolaricaulota bacterium]|nr:hypothetical protein [Candidatus Bipolaricaulota bacterium]